MHAEEALNSKQAAAWLPVYLDLNLFMPQEQQSPPITV